jgi:hypothetical protein
MKNIYFLIILSVTFFFTGCVDDFTDSNPPDQLDAPFLRIETSDANAVVKPLPLNKYNAFVTYGQPVTFTVTVVDAPGTIGAIDAASSIEEFGTVTVGNDASALIGKKNGQFTVTFTPSSDLPDTDDRSLNLEVYVTDSQKDDKGEASPKTTTLTVPLTIGSPCLSEGISAGTYVVTEASGNLDGGDTYDLSFLTENSASAFAANQIVVVITKDRPGVYTFSEVTGGVWPLTGGAPEDPDNGFNIFRSAPEASIDLCDKIITGRSENLVFGDDTEEGNEEVEFTVDGTLNDDGTISIDWSYVRTDGNTPATPAMGSYKLTKLQ